MAENKVFIGPRVRRIRSNLKLSQTAMAQQLNISPSYLNLIERNQRPLTAQLVMKLVSTFKIDVDELQPSGEAGSVAALKEVFSDPLLTGELPGDTELIEISDGAPNAAIGIVKLYRAYREQQERLSDLSRLMGQAGHVMPQEGTQWPIDLVHNHFASMPWCFPALERAAERIHNALNKQQGRMASLYSLLRSEHGISVQVLPVETMPIWKKRYDRHSQRLFISERLPRPDRAELLAQELVLLREAHILEEEIELLDIKGDEAKRLARMELARYTALAVLMPYQKFLRTTESVSHDLLILATRYEMGISQIAQRLVALQDQSNGNRKGLPFFMMEVDQGGNILRRIGAKGFPLARFGGHCPKLSLHAAFSNPEKIMTERVMNPDGDVYLTIARTVAGPQLSAVERPNRTAILLGVEDLYAKTICALQGGEKPKRGTVIMEQDDIYARTIVYARHLPDPLHMLPTPIGPSCKLCERHDCIARSAQPLTQPLGLDDLVQGFGAYGLT